MRIARDGTWYHDGAPIRRPAMVRLFSTVLRREPDGRHVLVTPVEKLDIEVEATAFRAIEMHSEGDGRDRRIAFALDSGDAVILGPEHPLRIVETATMAPRRALLVRHGLEAELTRAVYYELAELALARRPRSARHVERRRLLPAGGAANDASPTRFAQALRAAAERRRCSIGDLPELRRGRLARGGGSDRDHRSRASRASS